MKKLFITAVFALGSLTAFAQEAETTEEQDAATEVQEEATDASADAQESAEDATSDDGFTVIAVEEVPAAIVTMIETNYPGASMDEAHKNEMNHYKVMVTLEDGTSGALILDEEGNAVEQ